MQDVEPLLARAGRRGWGASGGARGSRGFPGRRGRGGGGGVWGTAGAGGANVRGGRGGRSVAGCQTFAGQLLAASRRLPGTSDHTLSSAPPTPEHQLLPDRLRAAERGVSVEALAATVQLATASPRLATLEDAGQTVPCPLTPT